MQCQVEISPDNSQRYSLSRQITCRWQEGSHSQPMEGFPFHRNCTSQSHGTAGSRKAGGFVNSTVSKANLT